MNYLQMFILLGFLFMSTIGSTQPNKPQPKFPVHTQGNVVQREVEKLRAILNLTEDQTRKVTAIENKIFSEYVASRNEAVSGVARKENLQQLQKDKEVVLKKVLTPAQWTIYVVYMEKQSEKVKKEMEVRQHQLQAESLSKENGL